MKSVTIVVRRLRPATAMKPTCYSGNCETQTHTARGLRGARSASDPGSDCARSARGAGPARDRGGAREKARAMRGVRRRMRPNFHRGAMLGLPPAEVQRMARHRFTNVRARVSDRSHQSKHGRGVVIQNLGRVGGLQSGVVHIIDRPRVQFTRFVGEISSEDQAARA